MNKGRCSYAHKDSIGTKLLVRVRHLIGYWDSLKMVFFLGDLAVVLLLKIQ